MLVLPFVFLSRNPYVHTAKIEIIGSENNQDTLSLKFLLGRRLFYSLEFSKNYNTSCATCHLQATGFAHVDHQLSHGTHGDFGTRNAPGLSNLAEKPFFMWDGRITDLKTLSEHPITDPLEMDMTFDELIVRLEQTSNMQSMFEKAYGSKTITKSFILDAIYVFLINLKSDHSKFDQVITKKSAGIKFTPEEQRGFMVFNKQCASCHSGNNFTNNQFESNQLPVDKALNDGGRYNVTKSPSDYGKFLVPSLRNVVFTFPYMHDGRFENLDQVLLHYQQLKNKKGKLSKIKLSNRDIEYLKHFFNTLTDTSYILNPTFGFPPNEIN
ncbi:MAG: cytochrome-c peroxidase [Fluviicola sp.]|nr:cytochrome-c peroxidase [Fluviicola sp.]